MYCHNGPYCEPGEKCCCGKDDLEQKSKQASRKLTWKMFRREVWIFFVDLVIAAMVVGVVFGLVYIANAQSIGVSLRVPCTNQNYMDSPVCKPVDVNQSYNGFYGTLANGEPWTQTWITSSLMLFEGDQMKWLTNGYTTVYLD